MDFEQAIKFVESKGNEVEQARLSYFLAGESFPNEVIARLFARQQADGGWSPFWVDNYSSLDATCFRLAQAEQLGIAESEIAVRRAVNFLAQRQSYDGSWEEDEKITNSAPPWAKPGDLSAKLYLTANCGLWLALLGNPDNRAFKAAAYLQTHLGQDGYLPSFLHTHWLAGGLLYKLDWQIYSRIFEYLSKRINDLAVSNLSWLITTLYAAGVPISHYLVVEAASLLEQSQQDDGHWESEDGSSQNVHSTLEAMRALWLCGRV